jgi:hypothetical protein
MTVSKSKPKNWGLQVALCAGVVVWQVYELATATEAPSTALLALQYILIACGLVGGVGGLIMMARTSRPPGGDD